MAFGDVGMFAGLLLILLLVVLALYVYTSLALMFIARRTNTPNAWLAWIPIANVYLLTQIAQVSGWWTLAVLIGAIPILGFIVLTGLSLWWFWRVAERVGMPGWTGLLMIIPVVNLIMLGVFAWKD